MSQDKPVLVENGEPDLPERRHSRHIAARLAFRLTTPNSREAFTSPVPDLQTWDRLYYQTEDGWEAPLWKLPLRPGASGEPVLLAHCLGASPSTFAHIEGAAVAQHLQAAGFRVYLMEHRGDRNAVGAGAYDFDDIVEFDVPAVLAAIQREVPGRVHWMGHGMGGLLGLAYAALNEGQDIASIVGILAPLRFDSHLPPSSALAGLVPAHWRVPLGRLQRLGAPLASGKRLVKLGLGLEGPDARGFLLKEGEDIGIGLLRQLKQWHTVGFVSDRSGTLDYGMAGASLDLPMLWLTSEADPRANPPSLGPLRHKATHLTVPEQRMAVLLDRGAVKSVTPHLLRWLRAHREQSWEALDNPLVGSATVTGA